MPVTTQSMAKCVVGATSTIDSSVTILSSNASSLPSSESTSSATIHTNASATSLSLCYDITLVLDNLNISKFQIPLALSIDTGPQLEFRNSELSQFFDMESNEENISPPKVEQSADERIL
jgi:hypothetical protein